MSVGISEDEHMARETAKGGPELEEWARTCAVMEQTARVWRWVHDPASLYDHNVHAGLRLSPLGDWAVIEYRPEAEPGFDAFLPTAFAFSTLAKADEFLQTYRTTFAYIGARAVAVRAKARDRAEKGG